MRIIKSERIAISANESNALDLVDMILDGIMREASDPELLRKIEIAQNALSDVYEYIENVEMFA
jgi:hypothetical protein